MVYEEDELSERRTPTLILVIVDGGEVKRSRGDRMIVLLSKGGYSFRKARKI